MGAVPPPPVDGPPIDAAPIDGPPIDRPSPAEAARPVAGNAGVPPALDPGTAWGRVLGAIYDLQDAEALFQARLRDKLDIGTNELVAVQFIARHESRGIDARPKDVAATLGVTSSAASIILGHLVDRGYVTRHVNPHDARGVFVHLTPSVRDAVAVASGGGRLGAFHRMDDLSDRESRRVALLLGTVTASYGRGARPQAGAPPV